MGDLYVCNSAFHFDYVAKISIFTFAGIFLYFSLSTLSLYSYTLFSHYYYYYCCHWIESHRIKLLLCQRVNESHNFFLSFIIYHRYLYWYLSKNAVFVNYLKSADTLYNDNDTYLNALTFYVFIIYRYLSKGCIC